MLEEPINGPHVLIHGQAEHLRDSMLHPVIPKLFPGTFLFGLPYLNDHER